MLKIFRIPYNILCWIIVFLLAFLELLIIGLISQFIKDKKGIYHLGTQFWAKTLLVLANIRVEVKGLENVSKGENYIFASNHESSLDILVLAGALPQRFLFVMREELFKTPFIGTYCKNAGYISLNIKDPKKSYQDIQNIIGALKGGESIVYYPEGGRKKELQEFKSGIARIALESQIPVIPIAIYGSAKLMPRRSFIFSPGIIKVFIGKPMQFDKNETYQEVTNKIRKTIADRLKDLSLISLNILRYYVKIRLTFTSRKLLLNV